MVVWERENQSLDIITCTPTKDKLFLYNKLILFGFTDIITAPVHIWNINLTLVKVKKLYDYLWVTFDHFQFESYFLAEALNKPFYVIRFKSMKGGTIEKN